MDESSGLIIKLTGQISKRAFVRHFIKHKSFTARPVGAGIGLIHRNTKSEDSLM